jgi:hypothetical protein
MSFEKHLQFCISVVVNKLVLIDLQHILDTTFTEMNAWGTSTKIDEHPYDRLKLKTIKLNAT